MPTCTIECQYNRNGNCHFHNACIIKIEFDKEHHPSAQLTVLPPQTSFDAQEPAKQEIAKKFNPFQRGNGCLLDEQHTR